MNLSNLSSIVRSSAARTIAATAALACATLTAQAAQTPKLIEWGWDEPTAQSMRANIERMEKAPFNGVVLNGTFTENGKPVNFTWEVWSKRAFTRDELAPVANDLKATKFQRFTDNFLRFNTAPGDVDWFDDAGWKAICNNGAVAAWVCEEGGLKGLMFDTEQYKFKPYHYAEQPQHGSKSLSEYKAMARTRGRELGAAMAAVKPDIKIMFTFANTVVNEPQVGDAFRASFDLLPAFLDGMIEGTGNRATLYDALEAAYPFKTRAEFEKYRGRVKESRAESRNPTQYAARMKTAFGIWLDYDWRRIGWNPTDTAKNHFQPAELKSALENALATTDEYVWLYSEKVNWWTGGGLSPQYKDAVEAAYRSEPTVKGSARRSSHRRLSHFAQTLMRRSRGH
jgi:hypothetical protein